LPPNQEKIIMTTTNIAITAFDKPVTLPAIPTRGTTALHDAIYIELAAKASLEFDWVRQIDLCLQTSDESDAEIGSEADDESEVLMFIAVDHVKPIRFVAAAVKAEPGFDYTDALSDSAIVRSDCSGFKYTFYIDEPCECVISSFVHARPRFGILERAGHLFVGVGLDDLQAFAAMAVNAAGTPNAHLSMETSAAGNGFMLELVNHVTGERLYSRFVVLPKRFMAALRRAITRKIAAPSQLPLELQRATSYRAFFHPVISMTDCWKAARHIAVGIDCPVQRLWIRAHHGIAIVGLAGP
jgi:hypothetical protein